MWLLPMPGADAECDEADQEVADIERVLKGMLAKFKKDLK
jgi:hypothetical protein